MSKMSRRDAVKAGATIVGALVFEQTASGATENSEIGEIMMQQEKPLPTDLEAFRKTYVEMFGEMPPLPAAKFEFGGETDAQAVRLNEQYRAHAFYNKNFDAKTTQLLIFGMLLTTGTEAAKHHAQAARRAGASWQELFAVAELASAVASLGPVNQASAMLKELRGKEQDKNNQPNRRE